jgi:hypothetical protein
MPPAYCGFGGQLIVDAGVAHGVLAQALDVVDGLGGIGVADKFGVEIERMIGRLQREAEVVHGEDVFEELGVLEVADAAGLARGVELMGQRVGAGVEVVVVRDSLMRTPQRMMEGWFQSRRIMRLTLSTEMSCQG